MKLKYNGIKMDVDIMGGFKIDTHEYAVCSYMDSENNFKVIIVEILRDGDNIKTKNIPEKYIDMVISKYEEIKNFLLGGNKYE